MYSTIWYRKIGVFCYRFFFFSPRGQSGKTTELDQNIIMFWMNVTNSQFANFGGKKIEETGWIELHKICLSIQQFLFSLKGITLKFQFIVSHIALKHERKLNSISDNVLYVYLYLLSFYLQSILLLYDKY